MAACIAVSTLDGPPPASAALPELGRCSKVARHTGSFEARCRGPATPHGNFEWLPGAVRGRFTLSAGVVDLYESQASYPNLTCSGASGSGEYVGGSEELETISLTGCQGVVPRDEHCESAGAQPGEIHTSLLRGLYGFIAAPEVGVTLEPAFGDVFAEFACEREEGEPVGEEVLVTGSVIAPTRPVSQMASAFTRRYLTAGGILRRPDQVPERLESGARHVLFSARAAIDPLGTEAGLTGTFTVANEERLEIRATE